MCTANCSLQMEISTAKCDLRNGTTSTIFTWKSLVKFVLKNKQLFCLSHEKAAHQHVDEIDALLHLWFHLSLEGIIRDKRYSLFVQRRKKKTFFYIFDVCCEFFNVKRMRRESVITWGQFHKTFSTQFTPLSPQCLKFWLSR